MTAAPDHVLETICVRDVCRDSDTTGDTNYVEVLVRAGRDRVVERLFADTNINWALIAYAKRAWLMRRVERHPLTRDELLSCVKANWTEFVDAALSRSIEDLQFVVDNVVNSYSTRLVSNGAIGDAVKTICEYALIVPDAMTFTAIARCVRVGVHVDVVASIRRHGLRLSECDYRDVLTEFGRYFPDVLVDVAVEQQFHDIRLARIVSPTVDVSPDRVDVLRGHGYTATIAALGK